MNLTLRLRFPKNREKLGECELITADGETLFDLCRVLGRSDNAAAKEAGNASRDPLKRLGDFPLGRYRVTVIEPGANLRSFGPLRRLAFEPISGPALEAKQKGKRDQIEGHAGAINVAFSFWSGLRPTHGCVRFHEDDLACILAILDKNPKSKLYADVTEID